DDVQAALDVVLSDETDPYLQQAASLALDRVIKSGEWRNIPEDDRLTQRLHVWLLLHEVDRDSLEWHALALLLSDNPSFRFIATRAIADHELHNLRDVLIKQLHSRSTSQALFEATLAAIAKLDGVMDKWNKGLVGDWWHKQSKTYEIAAGLLTDASAPSSARKWSLRILPPNHTSLDAKRLDELLTSPDETLRAEAVLAVRNSTRLNDVQRANRLLKIAQDTMQPAAIRAEATIGLDATSAEQRSILVRLAQDSLATVRDEALRTLRGAALDDSQRDTISQLTATDPATADLVAQVLSASSPSPPLTRPLDEWLTMLEGPADAEAGERIFFHPKGPGCYHCHMIEGRGRAIGPEFTRTAGKLGIDRRRLVESILFPSKEIAPAYVPWNIITTDGRALTGIFHRDNGRVRSFWDARGELFEVKVSDIEEMLPQRGSIMPENLAATMTTQEFRNLLAFLIGGGAHEK
ncbi:MAG TPA: hypothetical protein VHV77_13185, partial [Pirellulales bacterium]|nr:hypothetical protein [Pirellulales bacterium]